MSAFDYIPAPVGLPASMKGDLDYKIANGVRSYSVRVQPTSNPVTTTTTALTASSTPHPDIPQQIQNIVFDLPCSGDEGLWIDPRQTTLNFKMTLSSNSAGSANITTGYLRSNAMAFFDRATTIQSGQQIDICEEFGLLHDTLLAGQFSSSDLDGTALLYGFLPGTANERQGLALAMLTANTILTTQSETHNFSVPLVNPVFGVTASKMINVGRLANLQYQLQTASVLPITMTTGLTPGSLTVTLSDFSIGLEMVSVPRDVLSAIDSTLVNGKMYNSGIAYRTGSTNLSASAGAQSLLCSAVKGSSVKSIFARFVDGGTANTTNSSNGKYDAKNPIINSYSFNVGSVYYPNYRINPLIAPSNSMIEFFKAMGSFNNSQIKSNLIPAQYCKLSAGGSAQALTLGSTQAYEYNLGSANDKLCSFIIGQNLEVVARNSLVSGINTQSANVFLEVNLASAPTNAHNVYITSMNDVIYEHDIATRSIRAIM